MTQPIGTLTEYLYASQAFSNFNNPDHPNYAWRKDIHHQVCAALGLAGEAGEALEAFMALQNRWSAFDSGTLKTNLSKELGDVVWYIAQACDAHGIDIETLKSESVIGPLTAIDLDLDLLLVQATKGHADYMKKVVYHGHKKDNKVIAEHLRTVLAKTQRICTKAGFDFWAVLTANIAKLEARYPEGRFTIERSVNRAAEA